MSRYTTLEHAYDEISLSEATHGPQTHRVSEQTTKQGATGLSTARKPKISWKQLHSADSTEIDDSNGPQATVPKVNQDAELFRSGLSSAKGKTKPKANTRSQRRRISHNILNLSIYKTQPLLLAGLVLMCCLALMISHHIFLSHWDTRSVLSGKLSQRWVQRLSLAFSLIIKIMLVVVASLALRQRLWYSLRSNERGLRVATIDALFTIESRLLSFLSIELWSSATVIVAMAAVIWALPFITVFAPSALIVITKPMPSQASCVVPNLNFTGYGFEIQPDDFPDSNKDYELMITQDENDGSVLSDFDSTTHKLLVPSAAARRIALLAMYIGDFLNLKSPCGTDCSYKHSFLGPAARCTTSDPLNSSAPWSPEQPSFGAYEKAWNSTLQIGQAFNGTNPWWPGSASADVTPNLYYRPNATFQRSVLYQAGQSPVSGIFWLGHTYALNLTANTTWSASNDIEVVYCELWNATYNLQQDFVGGISSTSVVGMDYLNSVNMTKPSMNELLFHAAEDRLFSSQLEYNSLFTALIEILAGVESDLGDPFGPPQTNTSTITNCERLSELNTVVGWRIPYTRRPIRNLRLAIEETSRNITLSLLPQRDLAVSENLTTDCTFNKIIPVWDYNQTPLLASYGAGLGAAILLLLVAAASLYSDGGAAPENKFSSILKAAGNPELHDLIEDNEDEEVLLQTRLRYTKVGLITTNTEGKSYKYTRPTFVVA